MNTVQWNYMCSYHSQDTSSESLDAAQKPFPEHTWALAFMSRLIAGAAGTAVEDMHPLSLGTTEIARQHLHRRTCPLQPHSLTALKPRNLNQKRAVGGGRFGNAWSPFSRNERQVSCTKPSAKLCLACTYSSLHRPQRGAQRCSNDSPGFKKL